MIETDGLVIAGYRVSDIKQKIEFHSHFEYEIYLFHSGVCRYFIHNQIYDLKPGDILLMDGLTLHKPNVPPDAEYVRSVVQFSPEWIRGMLKAINGMYLLDIFEKLHHYHIRTKENSEFKALENVIRRLEQLKQHTDSSDFNSKLEAKVLLVQALNIINRLGNFKSNNENNKSEKVNHAENIANFIKNNYKNDLTIHSIARSLNISKFYVSRVFKEMTGFTVMEYVMSSRLTEAKYLLETAPEKPLKDIALESGFKSTSHFSRFFKGKVGVTPMAYRQRRLKFYSEENEC